MAEIDVLLSASLKRVAQPGDAAGVADAIRSRVAAGDTGAPAASSGFGGGGVLSWLPWIGLLVVAGLVGGTAGATGVFGREIDEVTVASSTAILSETATAYACPGGPVVGSVAEGSRVLAIKRSDDSAYLAVRDPRDIRSTVWLDRAVVEVDAGIDVATLPTGACPFVTIPKPVIFEPAPPVDVTDKTAPSIAITAPNPSLIWGLGAAPYCVTSSSIVASVNDDEGIARVSARTSFPGGSVVLESSSGATYVFAFSAPYVGPGNSPQLAVTIVITAIDKSGNETSATTSLAIVDDGSCLI